MKTRIVIITDIKGDSWHLEFDSSKVSDSEALHYLLVEALPSDEYTVTFNSLNNFAIKKVNDDGTIAHINYASTLDGAMVNINQLADLYKGTKFYVIDSAGRIVAEAQITRKEN